MQVALLVPEQEWRQLLADVQRLKEFEAAAPKTPPTPPDRLFTVREAADYLRITPDGMRKARRAGRLTGAAPQREGVGLPPVGAQPLLNRYTPPAAAHAPGPAGPATHGQGCLIPCTHVPATPHRRPR